MGPHGRAPGSLILGRNPVPMGDSGARPRGRTVSIREVPIWDSGLPAVSIREVPSWDRVYDRDHALAWALAAPQQRTCQSHSETATWGPHGVPPAPAREMREVKNLRGLKKVRDLLC